MKTSKNQFSINFDELEDGEYLNLWSNCVKKRLPKDFSIEFREIKSEVVEACLKLAKSFDKSKGLDFITYCNLYVTRLATNAIWSDYHRMKSHKSIVNDYAEFFSDYAVVENKLHDNVDQEWRISNIDKHAQANDVYSNIERRIDGSYVVEKWTKLYESALELDKQTDWYFRFAEIVDMLKMKMTESEIGEELGIDQAAVHKRIMKIVKAIGANKND